MKLPFAVAAFLALPVLSVATTPAKKQIASKSVASHSSPAHGKTAIGKTSTGKTLAGKTASGKAGVRSTAKSQASASAANRTRRGKAGRMVATRGARPSTPSYQVHPEPERYREIQNALSAKGYYKGEVNGEWGPDSVDALKRFQVDQKIQDDGKINSLSLIGLGLGPHQTGAALHPVAPAASGTVPNVEPPPTPEAAPQAVN